LEALRENKDYANLHAYARGDHLAATQASINIRPRLEEIWDKLDKHQQLAKELERLQQQLMDMLQEQIAQAMAGASEGEESGGSGGESDEDSEGETEGQGQGQGEGDAEETDEEGEGQGSGDGDGEGDGEAGGEGKPDPNLQDKIDAMEKLIEQIKKEMELEQDSQMVNIRKQLDKGISDALTDASNMESVMSLSYGTQDGKLSKMNIDERLELAKKINNEKFKKVAEILGPVQRYMNSARRRKTKDSDEEIVDITMGNDLFKVVPSEFAKLHNRYSRLLFMKDFFGEKLPQYEMNGEEKIGKGDIICCIDTSGSMHGQREVWAKAVGLALLHLSRQQKRGFYGMNFSSAHQCKEYDFGKESDFSIDRIVAFAGENFFGGTDFKTPLQRSLTRLQEQHAKTKEVKADIVFITDGECHVDPNWLKKFKEEQERLDFQVWGVLVGGARKTAALVDITGDKIITTNDIVSGKDLDRLWQGL